MEWIDPNAAGIIGWIQQVNHVPGEVTTCGLYLYYAIGDTERDEIIRPERHNTVAIWTIKPKPC